MLNRNKTEDLRLDNLREWYGRRSKEFESSNYPKYKEDKKANNNEAKEYSKFERKLQFEQETFQRKLNEKLNSMEICQPKTNKKITMNTHQTLTAPSQSCRIQTVELLRPEDLLTFDDTEEIADESNSLLPIPNTAELQLSGGFPPQLDFTFSQEHGKKHTEDQDYKRNISGIKEDWQKIEFIDSPKDSNSNGKNQAEKCAQTLSKWLNHYSSFYLEIQEIVTQFVNDQSKKEIRVNLTRTLANRINDCAKKSYTKLELATLSNFLQDLFEGKMVKSWKTGEEIQMDRADRTQQLYAMYTICERYCEQIKWDLELMDQVLLVFLMLNHKQSLFYEIFCAKILDSLALFSFSLDKVISKINSFGTEEAASHWISNEQAIFRLFCRFQLAYKSTPLDEKHPYKTRGVELLRMIFVEAVQGKPVPLCTPFILGEILNNFTKQLINGRVDSDFAIKLTRTYFPLIRRNAQINGIDGSLDQIKSLSDTVKFTLDSRQRFLTDLLKDAIDKIEKQLTNNISNPYQ